MNFVKLSRLIGLSILINVFSCKTPDNSSISSVKIEGGTVFIETPKITRKAYFRVDGNFPLGTSDAKERMQSELSKGTAAFPDVAQYGPFSDVILSKFERVVREKNVAKYTLQVQSVSFFVGTEDCNLSVFLKVYLNSVGETVAGTVASPVGRQEISMNECLAMIEKWKESTPIRNDFYPDTGWTDSLMTKALLNGLNKIPTH